MFYYPSLVLAFSKPKNQTSLFEVGLFSKAPWPGKGCFFIFPRLSVLFPRCISSVPTGRSRYQGTATPEFPHWNTILRHYKSLNRFLLLCKDDRRGNGCCWVTEGMVAGLEASAVECPNEGWSALISSIFLNHDFSILYFTILCMGGKSRYKTGKPLCFQDVC